MNSKGEPVPPRPKKKNPQKKHPQTCHLCGKYFNYRFSLQNHLRYFHDKNFDKHCHVCGLGVWSKKSLHLHLLNKHKDDPITIKLIEDGTCRWKCTVVGCRHIYWNKANLEEHIKKEHSLEGGGIEKELKKNFKCSYCGKLFRQLRTLNLHEFAHTTEERPFTCDKCGVSFKVMAYLKRHIKRFHEETNS